ncbi:MAG TPA: hypothetical protein VI172_05015 [Candidatus Dormibacteraeota bacterium]|jgi:hypothetical protein
MTTEKTFNDIPLPGMPEPPLTVAGAFGIPVGIEQLPEPCWVLDGDDGQHFDTEQDALEAYAVDPERYDNATAKASPARCRVARSACGKYVGTEDFDVLHQDDPVRLLESARAWEFEVIEGVLRCEDSDLCEVNP